MADKFSHVTETRKWVPLKLSWFGLVFGIDLYRSVFPWAVNPWKYKDFLLDIFRCDLFKRVQCHQSGPFD